MSIESNIPHPSNHKVNESISAPQNLHGNPFDEVLPTANNAEFVTREDKMAEISEWESYLADMSEKDLLAMGETDPEAVE